MENFVLYEEVGKGEHCIVYKGRRKGTINFVAIHCIEKCRRPHITNLVRLTHELDHANIVRFYEWYETSNHLWLVVELCTGGSLETVISQDDHLPESSVRRFGLDLVQGLHHIHSLGIIFSDIKPSKILLDGPGVLKFADFGLSRVEGENLDELFEQFADAGEQWETSDVKPPESELTDVPAHIKMLGTPSYMAPEVIQGKGHCFNSDLWSLGCVFYEMFCGHPPFLADSYQQLADKIISKEFPQPKVKGSRVSSKASPEFLDLLKGLLEKDPDKRTGWEVLVTHPFWKGDLQKLVCDLETNNTDLRQSVQQSIANFSARASVNSEFPKGNSVLGQIHDVDVNDGDTARDLGETAAGDTLSFTNRPDSTMSVRPLTAPGSGDAKVSFTLSSRPSTAMQQELGADDHISAHKMLTQSPLSVREALRKARQGHETGTDDLRADVSQLIYHTSDFTVTPIVDNPKIQKCSSYKYDAKGLPVTHVPAEKILSLSASDSDKHMSSICESLSSPEKGPASQRRLQLLHYLASLATSSGDVANMLVQSGILGILARLTREAQHVEMKSKLSRVLAIIASNANMVEESANLNEVISQLTELVRENFRNSKVKLALLPALGEVLYLIASQEEVKGHGVNLWAVPSMTYTLIIRCLREGEEPLVNHYVAKIIENITTTKGVHSQKFSVSEVGQLLWNVFTHGTADTLRVTALTALCRVTKVAVNVFHNVIEKVGLPKMVATMATPVSRIQQAVITMFASLIMSDMRLTRVIQDKEFVTAVVRLLESPSVIIRAKAFLVILEITRSNTEMLVHACQARLVMYIERDLRRGTIGKSDASAYNADYLARCLDLLVSTLVDILPTVCRDILSALENVSGRKHPSTVQAKQLKTALPMMPVILHLISSSVFRPRLINDAFMKDLGNFLSHVKSIDTGTTQIHSATGASGADDFIHTVFAVVETVAQHPAVVTDNHTLIVDKILPPLASLVNSAGGDTRALSLRLFSELACVFLTHDLCDPASHKAETKALQQLIITALLPQYEQILLEPDPLPSYALKLLHALLEQNASTIRDVEKLGMIPVLFQVLIDHQNNVVGNTVQLVIGIIHCLVTHKETNMRELYSQGFITHLTGLFANVCNICLAAEENIDLKLPLAMLVSLLDTLHSTLKYVSDVVRKALQVKKTGGGGAAGGAREAEEAEALLLTNKPCTELMSHLTHLLTHEDAELADLSLKCLSLLVQLFGGESSTALSPENMECYSQALTNADAKKQKVILRILKRMISTEKTHAETMRTQGHLLASTIKSLVQTASSHAEVALSSLAADILKVTGHM